MMHYGEMYCIIIKFTLIIIDRIPFICLKLKKTDYYSNLNVFIMFIFMVKLITKVYTLL